MLCLHSTCVGLSPTVGLVFETRQPQPLTRGTSGSHAVSASLFFINREVQVRERPMHTGPKNTCVVSLAKGDLHVDGGSDRKGAEA